MSYKRVSISSVNPVSVNSAVIQSLSIKSMAISRSLSQAGRSLGNEIVSVAKKETRGQTDRETAKVVHATTVAADASKNIVMAPFSRAYATQLSIKYKEALKAVNGSSALTIMKQSGFNLDANAVFIKASYKPDILRSYNERVVSYQWEDNVIRHDGAKFIDHNGSVPVQSNSFTNEISRQIGNYRRYEMTKNARVVSSDVRFRGVKNAWYHVQEAIKNRNLKLDKELEELDSAVQRLSAAENGVKVMPKRLSMSVFRAATFVVEDTDTMKGFHLLDATYHGLKLADKYLLTPSLNVAYNIGVSTYNKILTMNAYKKLGVKPLSLSKTARAARKASKDIMEELIKDKVVKKIAFKNLLSTSPIKRLPIRALARFNNFAVNKIFKSTSATAKAARTFADLALRKARGEISKDTYKAATKIVAKYVAKNANVPKPLKAIAKPFKVVAKGIGKGLTTMFKPFKAIANALSKLFAKIAEVMGKIAKTLGAFAVTVCQWMFGIIFAMYLLLGLTYLADQILNIFMMSDAEKYVKRAKIIYDVMEDEHNELVKSIKELCKDYDASDVEYLNGASENYKEVWCATSVMLQQDLNQFGLESNKKDLEKVAAQNYKITHKITSRPYTFYEQDGTERTALHVYVNILRDEAIAYENLSLYPKAEEAYETHPNINVDTNDWIEIVRATKLAVAKAVPTTKEGDTITININGTAQALRYDQSGFLSRCLKTYGAIAQNYSTYDLLTATSLNGFTRFRMGAWSYLKEGDILVSDKGCVIYAYTIGATPYIYDCSRAGSMYATCIPEDFTREYQIVWRPNDPGSITKELETGVSEYDLISATPRFSNEPEINEETGNEEGALIALKADLLDIIANPGKFDDFSYEFSGIRGTDPAQIMGGGVDHILLDETEDYNLSSTDFVRYVYARHGVQLPFDDERALMDMGDLISSNYNPDGDTDIDAASTLRTLQTGDIIWYIQPESETYTFVGNLIEDNDIDIWNVFPGTEWDLEVRGEGKQRVDIGNILAYQAIPLIYVGDNKVVGYSENLVKAVYVEDLGISYREEDLFTYDMSELDIDKMWFVCRPCGFTIKPIYGATMFFEGWTDKNIVSLMELLKDDCWNSGSLDLTAHGEVVDGEVDWSWYTEGTFINSSTKWQYGFNKEHYITWRNDLISSILADFDEYGILPSTSFSVAYALSGGRTSEESLLYYNVYEVLADPGDVNSVRIHRTDYDEYGNAYSSYHNYRKYNNYKASWLDWISLYKYTNLYKEQLKVSHRRPLTYDNWKTHDSVDYQMQLNGLMGLGVINEEIHDAATTVVEFDTGSWISPAGYVESDNSKTSVLGVTKLIDYDEALLRRREAIENIEFLSTALIKKGNEILACDGDPDEATYQTYYINVCNFLGEKKCIENIDKDLHISTPQGENAKQMVDTYSPQCEDIVRAIYNKHVDYVLSLKPKKCKDVECVDTNDDGYCDNCSHSLKCEDIECVDTDGDGYCDNCSHSLNEKDSGILGWVEDISWTLPIFIADIWD